MIKNASDCAPGLYQEFLFEREAVLREKWVMSEQAGRDVGFETALTSWVKDHRQEHRAWRAQQIAADPSHPLHTQFFGKRA
jgi:hypothetical protein